MDDERIQVLVVEDELEDFAMARALLERVGLGGIELDWRSGYRDALDALLSGRYDVCLLDYFLESGSGIDLLREIRGQGINTPVVLLTGKGGREVDVAAMQSGADGYLVKGEIDPVLLERTIRYALARRRAQEELREEADALRGAIADSPAGHFRLRPDGKLLDSNRALGRILGDPSQENLQRYYAASFFVHPHDRDRFRGLLEEKGRVDDFESRLSREDGGVIRVRTTARLLRDSEGRPTRVEGWLMDAGSAGGGGHLRGERRGKALFELLFHLSPQGVVLLDPTGRIRQTNPALERFLGIERTALQGRLLADLVEFEDQGDFSHRVTRMGRGEIGRGSGDLTLIRGDGEPLPARYLIAPVDGIEQPVRDLLVLLARTQRS